MRLVSTNTIGRGLLALAVLSTCVLSLPLTPSQLENEDLKVMKCIVEALADVLSRPHPVPVSEECLVTLKTDDRLVSVLRHHNFLKELQEIAVQGHQERAQRQRDVGKPDPTTQAPQTESGVADRSMLEALGGPGERSILSQKRRTGNGAGEEEKDESQGEEVSEEADMAGEMQVKREKRPRSHSSGSAFESSESRAEKREEEEEENEKKRANSEEENMMTTDKKETGSGERRKGEPEPRKASKKVFEEEDEDEIDKRSALFPPKQEEAPEEQEDEEEEETTSVESIKRWAKRGKASPLTRRAGQKEARPLSNQQEVPHHSQEVSTEEEEKKKREVKKSPEEKELQSIAREGPEERRGLEEEGSASRKSEEPEIERLAAIESELENVAQKLHELRQG